MPRQETMSLLGFPVFRYVDVNDSEDVIRANVAPGASSAMTSGAAAKHARREPWIREASHWL